MVGLDSESSGPGSTADWVLALISLARCLTLTAPPPCNSIKGTCTAKELATGRDVIADVKANTPNLCCKKWMNMYGEFVCCHQGY